MNLIDRYRQLYAGVVYDALYYDVGYRERFVIERSIRHLAGPVPMVGLAFTCWGTRPTVHGTAAGIDDADAVRLDIFEAMQPGDVVMMDCDQDATVAHFGDITAQILQQRGVSGIVIDGYTRDVGRLPGSLPVFARGAQPQDAYGKWSLQKHGEPVQFTTSGRSRITVYPGDVVFGDLDGVIVIPQQIAAEALEAAEKRLRTEDSIRKLLATGSPRAIYETLGRW